MKGKLFEKLLLKLSILDYPLRGSSLHLFLHSAVQMYEFHIFIISDIIIVDNSA